MAEIESNASDEAPESTSEESPSSPRLSIARKIVALIVVAPVVLFAEPVNDNGTLYGIN